MARSTKDDWLAGPSDLAEGEVEDVPVKGKSVKIRALSATTANSINSKIITTDGRGVSVDNVMLDVLRFTEGVVEPQFSEDEARVLSAKYGSVFTRVVKEIMSLSGIDEDAVKRAEARFPGIGDGAVTGNGDAPAGSGPPVPARSGGVPGDDGH